MSKSIYVALFSIALALLFSSTRATGTLIEFWQDSAGWHRAADQVTFIDFSGFPIGTPVTNQFPGFTVTNAAFIHNAGSYTDGFGLFGPNGIRITFDAAIHALAVDHLGVVKFDVFMDGTYLATTIGFNYAIPGGPFFSGIISTIAFDEVYMFRPQPPFSSNVISLDNFYWGMPVPSPGALVLFALAALAPLRRRRVP